MSKIFVPSISVDQWKELLSNPDRQWRTGYSARTLAYCWQQADGWPASVQTVFSRWGTEPFNSLQVLLALPEHQVQLPGGSRPSQPDIWVLARGQTDLVSIAVEDNVSEPFGPTLRYRNGTTLPRLAKRNVWTSFASSSGSIVGPPTTSGISFFIGRHLRSSRPAVSTRLMP